MDDSKVLVHPATRSFGDPWGRGASAWFLDLATAEWLDEGVPPKQDSTPECMTLHQAFPTDTKKLTSGGGASQ